MLFSITLWPLQDGLESGHVVSPFLTVFKRRYRVLTLCITLLTSHHCLCNNVICYHCMASARHLAFIAFATSF